MGVGGVGCVLYTYLVVTDLNVRTGSVGSLLISVPSRMVPYLGGGVQLRFTRLRRVKIGTRIGGLLRRIDIVSALARSFIRVHVAGTSALRVGGLPIRGKSSILYMIGAFTNPRGRDRLCFCGRS